MKIYDVSINGRPGGELFRNRRGRLIWFKAGRGSDVLPPRSNVGDARAMICRLARTSSVILTPRKASNDQHR